jgi:hypothetical protein
MMPLAAKGAGIMGAGTLCISKVANQPATYKATFVAYDTTPPSAVTIQGTEGLRSFLTEAIRLHEAERERAIKEVTERGLVVLRNIDARESSNEAA